MRLSMRIVLIAVVLPSRAAGSVRVALPGPLPPPPPVAAGYHPRLEHGAWALPSGPGNPAAPGRRLLSYAPRQPTPAAGERLRHPGSTPPAPSPGQSSWSATLRRKSSYRRRRRQPQRQGPGLCKRFIPAQGETARSPPPPSGSCVGSANAFTAVPCPELERETSTLISGRP